MWGFLPFFLFSLREMDRRGERQASADRGLVPRLESQAVCVPRPRFETDV